LGFGFKIGLWGLRFVELPPHPEYRLVRTWPLLGRGLLSNEATVVMMVLTASLSITLISLLLLPEDSLCLGCMKSYLVV